MNIKGPETSYSKTLIKPCLTQIISFPRNDSVKESTLVGYLFTFWKYSLGSATLSKKSLFTAPATIIIILAVTILEGRGHSSYFGTCDRTSLQAPRTVLSPQG